MKFIKKNYKFLLIFILSLIINFLFIDRFYDGPTQYGMAHAIIMGEIPYIDFNMVSTPLYPFVHSFFLLFYDSYLTFTIVNSLIFTMIFFFADKIIEKHFFTYFLICLLPLFDVVCPSYNLFCKLLIMIILYLEKNKKNDYLIGLFLGLLLLTKHSIGVPIILCSLLYRRDIKACLKRITGVIIPTIIFAIYLVITKSLYSFIDLTFLGLFDFGSKNKESSMLFIIIFILMFIYYIYDIFKGKSRDKYLSFYGIGTLAFMIPIFDFNHSACALLFFLLIIFVRKDLRLNYYLFNTFLVCLLCVFTYLFVRISYTPFYIQNFNHFPMFISGHNRFSKVLESYKKYPNSIMIDPNGVFYDIVLDKKITYFDVPLTGNYGHLGTDNMINKLEDDTYYFISKKYSNSSVSQFDTKLCDYIIENSRLVDSVSTFNIYYYRK